MNVAMLTATAERLPLPDTLTRFGISTLVERTRRGLVGAPKGSNSAFAEEMRSLPIAMSVDEANAQHYEVPARFFELVLGPQRKYSCCFYRDASSSLGDAEEDALEITALRAGLSDGQQILELGCGWGSLSLWMARAFPNARIVSVSNSHSQRQHIEQRAAALGLSNLDVVTADMNSFETDRRFDRVVSVEMFEHMANWRALLGRAKRWLNPGGRLFVHVFAHREMPYRFDHNDPADWIGKYFFTGGLMPSRALMYEFPDLFEVEADWWWSGTHYARTAQDWLANLDRNREAVQQLFTGVYGSDTALWIRRWRLFFLATAGLFGHAGGSEWGVVHYLLKPADQAVGVSER